MVLFFQRTCHQPTGMLLPALMAGSMIQRTSTGQLPKEKYAHLLRVGCRALQTGSQLINTRAQVDSERSQLGLRGVLDPRLLTGRIL